MYKIKSKEMTTKRKKELPTEGKWFIANNRTQKNVDVVNILPFVKIWYSKNYFLESGVFSPAFGIAISWLKWNYYFTMQKGY